MRKHTQDHRDVQAKMCFIGCGSRVKTIVKNNQIKIRTSSFIVCLIVVYIFKEYKSLTIELGQAYNAAIESGSTSLKVTVLQKCEISVINCRDLESPLQPSALHFFNASQSKYK